MKRRQALTLVGLTLLGCRSASRERRPAGQPTSAPDLPERTPRYGAAGDRYQEHLHRLRPRIPSGFSARIEEPFVVLGDGGEEQVARYAEGTIRWAVRMLKQDYFERDPSAVLEVWLFRNRASYEHHTHALFGHQPDTPYGYYSRDAGALIMNIATGGGTLVHEIVHPFMEANFPACPAWLNEGLGSLYEQSAERDGHIVGLTNWRLAGLQRAIERSELPSFAALTATSDTAFYNRDPGTNYAQARYLLMYLQEQGSLQAFYRRFVAGRDGDRTGFRTLTETLGEADMAAFQTRWQRWVMELRFQG